MTIKDIRASTGLSQSKFCEAFNIPLRSLQKWETGERNCPEYVVELIAYRVQNDPRFVLTGLIGEKEAEEIYKAERKRLFEDTKAMIETFGRKRGKNAENKTEKR